MYPSSASATTTAPANGGEAQCRGCSAPLPRAALGCCGILMFGTAETRDLCARCTLEYYYRTGDLGAGSSTSSSSSTGHATCPFAFAAAARGTPPAEKRNAVGKRPNRCAACPKKVGLLGFACRCGGTFCSVHRHAESHGCNFDYKYKGFARREPEANR